MDDNALEYHSSHESVRMLHYFTVKISYIRFTDCPLMLIVFYCINASINFMLLFLCLCKQNLTIRSIQPGAPNLDSASLYRAARSEAYPMRTKQFYAKLGCLESASLDFTYAFYQPAAKPSLRGSLPPMRTPVSGLRRITWPPPKLTRPKPSTGARRWPRRANSAKMAWLQPSSM